MAAPVEARAELRRQVIDLLTAESATVAKMTELGLGKAWVPARQQAITAMLKDLRAGKDIEVLKE